MHENDKPHAHRLIKKCGQEELDDPHDVPVSMETGYQAVYVILLFYWYLYRMIAQNWQLEYFF